MVANRRRCRLQGRATDGPLRRSGAAEAARCYRCERMGPITEFVHADDPGRFAGAGSIRSRAAGILEGGVVWSWSRTWSGCAGRAVTRSKGPEAFGRGIVEWKRAGRRAPAHGPRPRRGQREGRPSRTRDLATRRLGFPAGRGGVGFVVGRILPLRPVPPQTRSFQAQPSTMTLGVAGVSGAAQLRNT